MPGIFERLDWLYGRPGESYIRAHHDARDRINRIRVRGGLSPNPTETTDTFTGTGSQKIFQLTNRWVREVTSITVGGTIKTFGTAWWDAAGYDVYVNYPAGIIYFAVAPGNGVQVKVYYTYHTEVYHEAQVSPSPSGPWSGTEIEDRSITSLTEAELLASAVLQEYGTQIVVGSFLTNKLGLEPGMEIEVTDPVLGLSGPYTIRKVTTEIDKAGTGVIANVQFGGRPTKLSWLVSKLAPNMRAGAYGYYLKMAADQGASNSERVTDTATNYTAKSSDSIVAVTDTSSARTITLPNAATVGKGRTITIKDTSGAAGTNNITLSPASGTIDGSATQKINVNYGAYKLYSDGANWKVLSDTNLVAKDGTIKGVLTVGTGATTIIIDGVGEVIRSSNYSSGSAGWQIQSNGDAEFNDVTVRGTIVANSGTIGGWNINSNGIYTGSYDAVGYTSGGMTISSSGGIHMYNAYLDSLGLLTCKNADISGTITATSGAIGGWTINSSNGIYTGSFSSSGYTSSGLTLASGGSIHTPHCYINSAGITANAANISGATVSGSITATSGYIGGTNGWVISTGRITSADGDIVLDAGAGSISYIQIGGSSLQYNTATGRLFIDGGVYVWGELVVDSMVTAPGFHATAGGITNEGPLDHNGSTAGFFGKSPSSQRAHVSDVYEGYTLGDLDSEVEICVAMNEHGNAINDIIHALEAYGLLASS